MKLKAYKGRKPYIFVSYAHKNDTKVLPIIEALQQRGFRVWFDQGIEAGTEWPRYIATHIVGCSCVLLFMSPEYVESPNCRQEITYAQNKRKECLAVYLKEFTVSDEGLEMQLGLNQAIFYNRHSSKESFLEELTDSELLAKCRDKNHQNIDTDQVADSNWFKQAAEKLGEFFEEVLFVLLTPVMWIYDKIEYKKKEKAAKQGDAEAQCSLGWHYEVGDGVRKDGEKAVEWYTKSAEQGYAEAQWNLGKMYWQGRSVAKDLDHAMEWFITAAKQGDAELQYRLAEVYNGLSGACAYVAGVDIEPVPDKEKPLMKARAAEWYTRAAEQGYVRAQTELAMMYEYGSGVRKDFEKALEWCTKAAEQNDSWAMYHLGEIYYSHGDGKKSFEWFTKAAEQGDSRAMQALDRLKATRKSTEDKAKANDWLSQVSVQGDLHAKTEFYDEDFEIRSR